MKKIYTLLIVVIALLIITPACKKSSNNNNNTATVSTPYVTATIGAVSFSAKGFNQANGNRNSDTLYGFRGTDTILNTAIAIDLTNYKGPGTYTLTGSNSAVYSTSVLDIMAAYGTLTITDTVNIITGIFSFTCVDSTKITNGHFLILKS